MSFNAWDHSVPVTQARLRNRCLNDEEHMEIEEEIIRRIKARLNEYISPAWFRPALIFVAHLAGVAPSSNILEICDKDIKRRNLLIGKRADGIDGTDWHSHKAYADLIADAGRFAQERIALIDQRTMSHKIRIASTTSEPAQPKVAWTHEDRRAMMRRVV